MRASLDADAVVALQVREAQALRQALIEAGYEAAIRAGDADDPIPALLEQRALCRMLQQSRMPRRSCALPVPARCCCWAAGALDTAGIAPAARIAAATGARLASETFNARAARGAGRPFVQRVPYFGEAAEAFLAGIAQLVLVESRVPVNFFGYPGRRGQPLPPDSAVSTLATPAEDGSAALIALAERLAPGSSVPLPSFTLPERPQGPINAISFAAALARRLPEDAIYCDEAITAGFALPAVMAGAAPHDGPSPQGERGWTSRRRRCHLRQDL